MLEISDFPQPLFDLKFERESRFKLVQKSQSKLRFQKSKMHRGIRSNGEALSDFNRRVLSDTVDVAFNAIDDEPKKIAVVKDSTEEKLKKNKKSKAYMKALKKKKKKGSKAVTPVNEEKEENIPESEEKPRFAKLNSNLCIFN